MAVSIEEAVVAWIKGQTSLAGQLQVTNPDGSKGWQVYKETIPEGVVIGGASKQCAIAYEKTSDTRDRTLAPGVNVNKLARVMLTIEAQDEATLNTLTEAIAGSPGNQRLDGLTTQPLGVGSVSVWCQYCEIEDRPDDFAPNAHGADSGTFMTHMALNIAYLSP